MRRTLLCAVLFMCATSGVAGAQEVRPDSGIVPDRQLFHRGDLYVAGAFVAATALLLPLDQRLTEAVRSDRLLSSGGVQQIADAGSWFGGPGTFLIGGSMYAVGRLGRMPRMAELALHGTEAVLVGSVVSGAIKNIAGRSRPYVTLDSNAHDFVLGRGTQAAKYKSFPSGHATAAFSAAAAVVAETHEWWPRSTWYVAPVMYGGATIVGWSRIHNDQHWASDVVMGAAIGTFAGLKTVRFNHTRAGNRIDRILLGTRVVPTANGPAVGYSMTF